MPTNDRDLAPGSGKGFDNHANMCCHLKRETKRVCHMGDMKSVFATCPGSTTTRICVTVAGNVKREV